MILAIRYSYPLPLGERTPTHRTSPVVHIDRAPTFLARPPLPLGRDKMADAAFFYRRKVLDHTHAILRPVPFIEVAESLAGVISTIRTELSPPLFAVKDRAVLAVRPVRRMAPPAPVLFPEEGRTDGAVHTAGGDQRGPEGVLRRHG